MSNISNTSKTFNTSVVKNFSIISVSTLFLLFFAGCGEIEFPETIPESATPVSPATNLAQNPGDLVSPSPSPNATTEEPTPAACESVAEERDNLKDAITISQEELKTCMVSKTQLESSQSSSKNSTENIAKYKPFIEKYLTSVTQKEYPFELCGGIGLATSKTWYADFAIALEESNIQFAPMNRGLKPTDFGGVCSSETGNVALFLGASYKGKKEFHMIQYSIDSKKIEEAILLDGTCEICPNKFGKRDGIKITLIGEVGAKKQNYDYFYDSNIIKKK